MSRSTSHHHHPRVRHQAKKQVLFLSRSACDLWHYCLTRASETIHKNKRFSLISLRSPDHQAATFAAQQVRNSLQRLSAQSSEEQCFGFHVVCGECEGFVVRDGAVRNCAHQRESWCSGFSPRSRELPGKDAVAGKRGSQLSPDVRTSVLPLTAVASPGPESRGEGPGTAGLGSSRDEDRVEEGRDAKTKVLQPVPTVLRPGHVRGAAGARKRRSAKARVLQPVPTILRPGRAANGRGARTIACAEETVSSAASVPADHLDQARATANDGAESSSFHADITDQTTLRGPEALMQDWKIWSKGWEHSVTAGAEDTVADTGTTITSQLLDQPSVTGAEDAVADTGGTSTSPDGHSLCDPDTLMQEWREWSRRWERLVRSR